MIHRACPDLAAGPVTVCAQGIDSLALDIGGSWIFKLPRNPDAEARLLREARLLNLLAGRVSVAVPRMQIYTGDPLPPSAYDALKDAAKARLGEVLAQFYTDLHALPQAAARGAGAEPIELWSSAAMILRAALPILSADLHPRLSEILQACDALPPDPLAQVCGFFDGQGWNMAFDFAKGDLAGIFDYADSSIGDLHRDFVYPSMFSPDLTQRILTRYEHLTGLGIDRPRVALLTAVH